MTAQEGLSWGLVDHILEKRDDPSS
jgi:ATP-dependent Clp protease protease subunit